MSSSPPTGLESNTATTTTNAAHPTLESKTTSSTSNKKGDASATLNCNTQEIGLDDLDVAAWVLSKAFLDDRSVAYYGDCEAYPTTRESPNGMKIYFFFRMIMKAALLKGGRVVVATTTTPDTIAGTKCKDRELRPSPEQGGDKRINLESDERTKLKNGETIVGVACWWPPHKRLPVHNLPLMLRCGAWRYLKGWGLTGFKRTAIEYSGLSERTHAAAFESHAKKDKDNAYAEGNGKGKKAKALKPHDCWYLNIVMTVKEFEGQGVLSGLIREAYKHAQNTNLAPFILEAMTERSRDRYTHLGFEVEPDQPPTILGAGKVNETGLKVKTTRKSAGSSASREASDEKDVETASVSRKADGVEVYCMVNWNPQV
ncbi:hypothetical protein D9758_006446 [Tetrapyrgos nigripes]|uniref:N-acetyltransferase domain-containing protein n=1 Tax=Tetrapyrgos nigripes TaxID=182062 RepID=A0A8H5GKK8_9AGAR|nr:hypothetical protein D9758_006446 [Tetrapyrgos nigripes]